MMPLYGVCRRLETLETKTEEVAQAVAEGRQEGTSREEAGREQLDSLEKGLREVQRGVQLIRDKQVGSYGLQQ